MTVAKQKAKPGRKPGKALIPHAERANIVQDALHRLDKGETTDDIAKSHNVPGSTLRSWLLVDCPVEADHQRARYIATQLQSAIEDIEGRPAEAVNSNEEGKTSEKESREDRQLSLARARERFRAWAWVAERRLPHLFAQKQEVAMTIDIGLADKLLRARERVIEGECTPVTRAPGQSKDK